MPQNAKLRKSAPWPPNISDEHVSCTAPATQNASLQILFKSSTRASTFETATERPRFAHCWQGAKSRAPATQSDIWTSKSAPSPTVFYTFDLATCFAPQRRALFRHLNVLRATTACTFSTSQFPKVVRTRQFLTLLTLKCASHHNGVHFFCSFSSLTLPTSAFPSAHIVGSLTSKLPSILHDHILIVYTCIYIYIHTYWLYIHAYCIYIYMLSRRVLYFWYFQPIQSYLFNSTASDPDPKHTPLPHLAPTALTLNRSPPTSET